MQQLYLFSSEPRAASYSEWWDQRVERIAASKARGNKHLDQIPKYVEGLRGITIYNVHDTGERGTIRTVSNRCDVIVLWADQHSCEKNAIGLQDALHPRTGKVIGKESWLSPHEHEDYVVDGGTKARSH